MTIFSGLLLFNPKQNEVMHLKALCKTSPVGRVFTIQKLLVMKLTAIFLLVASLQVSARGFSQKVTLSESQASLQKIFREINKQTGFQFFYEAALLKQTHKVSINVTDASIEEALSICFRRLPLIFSIVDRTVVIRQQAEEVRLAPESPPGIDVRGRVVNEKGEPVVVSVNVKATKTGTSTNLNGEFELKNIDENATLVFTGVSIVTYEIQLKGRTDLSVMVNTKIDAVSDTVFVGYGSVRRKDLTGSVSSVNMAEVKNVPLLTVDNAIAGKAAGVLVTKADGSPGGA